MKKYFKVADNPILKWFIYSIILKFKLFDNAGKLKAGDRVRYNFYAKVIIDTIADEWPDVYTFVDYEPWSKSKENGRFTNGSEEHSCAVFWLKKV